MKRTTTREHRAINLVAEAIYDRSDDKWNICKGKPFQRLRPHVKGYYRKQARAAIRALLSFTSHELQIDVR